MTRCVVECCVQSYPLIEMITLQHRRWIGHVMRVPVHGLLFRAVLARADQAHSFTYIHCLNSSVYLSEKGSSHWGLSWYLSVNDGGNDDNAIRIKQIGFCGSPFSRSNQVF